MTEEKHESIMVADFLFISYGADYAEDINWTTEICPHIAQHKDEITDAVWSSKEFKNDKDYSIASGFHNWEIQCYKCLEENRKYHEFWLSEIMLYIIGLNAKTP